MPKKNILSRLMTRNARNLNLCCIVERTRPAK